MNPTTKGKVLVVDDDRLVLATVTHGLSQAGYEVIDADNGDDAILLARQHKPDLALLDIRMEGKTGFDVAAYLREYCQIPFMFLSAFADEATINQVKALGALTYLIKPLDIQQIVPAVEAAFANRPQALAAAAAASTTASALPLDDDNPLEQTVALAVGIVMHRHSLSRIAALERLKAQALHDGRTLEAVSLRLLDAQEVLSGLGPLH
ncbi:MAG TPA: response regulator [Aquabacterium sp.]|uniref:response regulator n=1 Tax=Aquabacterium sp. TaxID=1872578 RepID=UPI002E329307|nr:response regulator [Aquabacterium sp.]HEX5371484.1 response regulator [Aquabacterium sp.]